MAPTANPGSVLGEIRSKQRIGVRELARRLSVNPGHLSRVLRGAEASPELLARIGEELGVPPGKVLPLAGRLPATVERELAGALLVDGLLTGDQLDLAAKRVLRRRALARRAEREFPPSSTDRFDPSSALTRRGWRIQEQPQAPGLDLRFEADRLLYHASTQVEMRFMLSHALAHVLLEEAPACRFGIANDAELDAGVMGSMLLVPAAALYEAIQRASAGRDVWAEIGVIIDVAARDLGAPPWVVAERAGEEGFLSSIADVAEW